MMNSALGLLFKPFDWVLFSPEKENKYLETCYGPVKDEVTGECEVEGVIPPAVQGEFARMAPNPRFTPKGGYHWFDGDGMVHAIRFKGDKVTFSNRYVKTAKLAREEKEGGPVFENFGELSGRAAILRLLNYTVKKSVGYIPWKGQSRANTSLTFHAGQLMALWEGGLPYTVKMMCDGVVETIGEATFNGNLKVPFTAHPKQDPATGKLYGIGYQLEAKPYVTFFVLDVKGNVERQFPLPVDRPTMMHDFSITETHAVFLDVPLIMDPSAMLSGKLPIVFKKEAGARIGVLPLDATDASAMRWFSYSEGFHTFHSLNGWDVMGKGSDSGPEKIQVITCDIMQFDMSLQGTSKGHSYMPRPYLSTVDLNAGKVTHEEVLPVPQPEDPYRGYEFPTVRKSLLGRRMRYGYFNEVDGNGDFVAVVKIDTQASSPKEALVGRISFGEGMRGGECPFIPAGDKEDDGYIATFVSKADGTGTSDFCIWDAKTMESKPVARVKLPQRVPLGFHAIFMSEEDLSNQRA